MAFSPGPPPLLGRTGSRYFARLEGPKLADALPPPGLASYSPEHVAFAARAWTLRAEEEFRSAGVFAEIVAGLIDAVASVDLLAALSRVVLDEVRHATLCLDLAARFGAPTPAPALDSLRARFDQPGRSRRQRALALLLFEGAVGETVSSTLFHAGRNAAREPCTRAALGAILRDEARHASVCWQALGELLSSCTEEERAALGEDLRRSLGAFERSVALPALKRLEGGGHIAAEVFELGVIPPEVRVETFYRALERVALPRLRRLGFDSQAAWRDRYREADASR